MPGTHSIGIIGGTGMLGGAIADGLLQSGSISPDQLWIASRSGRGPDNPKSSGVRITTDNQQLVDACDLVLLCVPPANIEMVSVNAPDRLVVSVMAGVSIDRIGTLTGARRIVRAMSNPAARLGLAYSPWCAPEPVNEDDRQRVRGFLAAFGTEDEVPEEQQIDRFTAITGPVPGFVAYFADCMIGHAVRNGIDPAVAQRAVRQLFHASGVMLSEGKSPGEHVQEMIDYAGTTAAGLVSMRASALENLIDAGLEESYLAAQRM